MWRFSSLRGVKITDGLYRYMSCDSGLIGQILTVSSKLLVGKYNILCSLCTHSYSHSRKSAISESMHDFKCINMLRLIKLCDVVGLICG